MTWDRWSRVYDRIVILKGRWRQINFIVIGLSDFHSLFHLQLLLKFQNKIC